MMPTRDQTHDALDMLEDLQTLDVEDAAEALLESWAAEREKMRSRCLDVIKEGLKDLPTRAQILVQAIHWMDKSKTEMLDEIRALVK